MQNKLVYCAYENQRRRMRMEKQLWEHEIIEIAQGYAREGTAYVCLLCGTAFEAGRVYEMEGGLLYDAQGAAKRHVTQAHGTVADWL